jgi:hypothetical protein
MKHVKTYEQYSVEGEQMNEILGFSKVEKIVKLIKAEGKEVDLSSFSDGDIKEAAKSKINVGTGAIGAKMFESFLKEPRPVIEKLLIEAVLMKAEKNIKVALTYDMNNKTYGLREIKLKGVDTALSSPNVAS